MESREGTTIKLIVEKADLREKQESLRREDPERDSLIKQLQQQIDDLTVFLEEERLNHRETRRKATETIEERSEELTRRHEAALRELKEERETEREEQEARHQQIIDDNKKEHNQVMYKMKREMQYLQCAFESYKSQLHFETDERWKEKEVELEAQFEADLQDKIQTLRNKFQYEKSAEFARLEKEYKGEMAGMKREQRRELDSIHRKYTNHQQDLEKLEQSQGLLLELQVDYEQLTQDHDKVCKQLADLTRELTDTKVKLIGFEEHFADKVEDIDNKYRQQIQDLQQSIVDLRRQYVKKCGELYDEKALSQLSFTQQLDSAKQTMKYLIQTRSRAVVSVAACNPELEERCAPLAKERPASAPVTRLEADTAQLSAGETQQYTDRLESARRPHTSRPRIVQEIEAEMRRERLVGEEENVQDIFLKPI